VEIDPGSEGLNGGDNPRNELVLRDSREITNQGNKSLPRFRYQIVTLGICRPGFSSPGFFKGRISDPEAA